MGNLRQDRNKFESSSDRRKLETHPHGHGLVLYGGNYSVNILFGTPCLFECSYITRETRLGSLLAGRFRSTDLWYLSRWSIFRSVLEPMAIWFDLVLDAGRKGFRYHLKYSA